MGTQSLLFGLLGKKVIGVDLQVDRITIGRKRIQFAEKTWGLKLNVEFREQNIFDLPETQKFDVIYVQQAISHIHPAEDFLLFAYERLNLGGQIIVCDSNGLWLPLQFRCLRERGVNLYTTKKDPLTDKTVPYARERVFSLPRIQRMLKHAGFTICHRECFLGLRELSSDWMWNRVISKLNAHFLFSSVFGRYYVIAGLKEHP